MIVKRNVYSLPQSLSRSEAACRAFCSLPAEERESFVSGFGTALSRGETPCVSAQNGVFMQNTQNPKGILY